MKDYSIAADVGAGSGKMLAARFEKNRLVICDEFVFANRPVYVLDDLLINVFGIYESIQQGVGYFSSLEGRCDSLGIDTYGNGYGILDQRGRLIGTPHFYKDRRTSDILDKICKVVSLREFYEKTGVYPTPIRVLMQLYSEAIEGTQAIRYGNTFLPLPNLLNYFFTGEVMAEKTIASVECLLDSEQRGWNYDLFGRLSIPAGMFPAFAGGGSVIGPLAEPVAARLGCPPIRVINTFGHDTESAIIAAPRFNMNKLFVSLGTGFIFGTQTVKPIINDKSYRYCFKNMCGPMGLTSVCRDFPGFWILEQCLREWKKSDPDITYAGILEMTESAPENDSYINVADAAFQLHSPNMVHTIAAYCSRTKQPAVNTIGEIAKCLFESYALQIKWCYECLKEIAGKTDYTELVAIGGGTRNPLLIQMIADALQLPVTTGSPVASSMGNLLTQLYAKGELTSLEEMREVAYRSCDARTYEYRCSGKWDRALAFMKENGLIRF